ncbi:TPA: hypothetical protein N0F65_001332 [Lagenidium giganteum]|uniref:AAA+ ATPase domain-containing protein n=1 Tax=Lagenidium giganteum TaxID=4803 RepID=A0AAV2Z2N1_9STRA|nr:TPA: hypothetical protein N0F65_001332 [Lagenidium giganteum]
MATLTLRVHATDGTISSTARVSPRTSTALRVPWNGYVALHVGGHAPRVFRLAVDADVADEQVWLDHWAPLDQPQLPTHALVSVTVQPLPSHRVRVVQYLELVPVDANQPRVSTPYAKHLLKSRILEVADGGVVALQHQGLNYGTWRYSLYARGAVQSATQQKPMVNAAIVNEHTIVLVLPSSRGVVRRAGSTQHARTYLPIGKHGMHFRELLAMAFHPPEAAQSRREAETMLLTGPSGAGKSTLVQLAAKGLNASVLTLDASMLASPHVKMEQFFTIALRIQPSLLLIEDLELIFPRVLDETKYKMVCTLSACLEQTERMTGLNFAVVGTVTTIDALNERVRQLFAEEVALETPEKSWTIDLLKSLLPPNGQRPSHIASICRQIAVRASITDAPLAELSETDLVEFAQEIPKEGTRAFASSVPNVTWDDIGGLDDLKQSLKEMVVWPLERPEVFSRMGILPPQGMLLHGPPGTGKTMLAKAAAKASGCNFLNLSASDLMKAEFGESEKAITRAFDTARALSPCMIFIDEFQSLFGDRTTAGATASRMISQLLMEMDSQKDVHRDRATPLASDNATTARVFVLAATNCLSAIDPAFMQPGRFENILFVGLPNSDERRAILSIQQTKMPWDTDVNLDNLVTATAGANAASLVAVCQAAAIRAMQRIPVTAPANAQKVTMVDFEHALSRFDFDPGQPTPE